MARPSSLTPAVTEKVCEALKLGVSWEAADFSGSDAGEAGDSQTEEINVDDFDLGCKCPRCGFEFNNE